MEKNACVRLLPMELMVGASAATLLEAGSDEVFASGANSPAVVFHCREMNRLRLGFEVLRRKESGAILHATGLDM